MSPTRYRLPQPYRELDHTADLAVAVEGSSAAEALARLVLAEAALLAGGGTVEATRSERIASSGRDLTEAALGLLRELLYRFATERVIAASCEVLRAEVGAVEVVVEFGPYHPEVHAEGHELKAVTWHRACFEEVAGLVRAEVVFDV
jgi:SHS2 domain-containing protein